MVDGHDWISTLPSPLARHRRALAGLLDFCEAAPGVSSLSVGCSLGRGVAAEPSDVDAAVGVASDRGVVGAPRVREVETALVEPTWMLIGIL